MLSIAYYPTLGYQSLIAASILIGAFVSMVLLQANRSLTRLGAASSERTLDELAREAVGSFDSTDRDTLEATSWVPIVRSLLQVIVSKFVFTAATTLALLFSVLCAVQSAVLLGVILSQPDLPAVVNTTGALLSFVTGAAVVVFTIDKTASVSDDQRASQQSSDQELAAEETVRTP